MYIWIYIYACAYTYIYTYSDEWYAAFTYVTWLHNIASAATGALATAAKMSRGATAIYICICIHTYIYIHLFEYLK